MSSTTNGSAVAIALQWRPCMKKTKQLILRTTTVRNLSAVIGGRARETLEPRPRTYGCPSEDTVGCLPPKSDGCFTEVGCPTITQ
jgi:hypothetical protein